MKLTLFTSSLYLAALVASFFASWVTRELGRRKSMLLGGLIFLVGAAFNGNSISIAMLIVGRLLLGVGVGFSIQSVPLYVFRDGTMEAPWFPEHSLPTSNHNRNFRSQFGQLLHSHDQRQQWMVL